MFIFLISPISIHECTPNYLPQNALVIWHCHQNSQWTFDFQNGYAITVLLSRLVTGESLTRMKPIMS